MCPAGTFTKATDCESAFAFFLLLYLCNQLDYGDTNIFHACLSQEKSFCWYASLIKCGDPLVSYNMKQSSTRWYHHDLTLQRGRSAPSPELFTMV